MKRAVSVIFGVFLLAIGAAALAQDQPITVKLENVKWTDVKGCQVGSRQFWSGDAKSRGAPVQRIMLPPNALVPPHSHPDAENITALAQARSASAKAPKSTSPRGRCSAMGSFYLLPANTGAFCPGRVPRGDPQVTV